MPAELLAWLTEVWPDHDWRRAVLHKGCFHHVALTATAVARVSCHGPQPRRLAREHANLTAATALGLPVEHPRPLSGVVEDSARSAMLVTPAPGEHRPDLGWPSVAAEFARLLDGLRAVDPADVPRGIAAPRAWCGGQRWPDIVDDHIVAILDPREAALARRIVQELLAAEAEASTGLVHGDFGPHNVLWDGERIRSLIDFDHMCLGDPAIDLASLISFYGARAVEAVAENGASLERALRHRACFPLQLGAAAVLVGDRRLFEHALTNFTSRLRAGTLHDPHGRSPLGWRHR